jgi:hypothetical protein
MQIVRRGSHHQSARIFEPNLGEYRIRLRFGCKWAEAQAIPNASVVDALNLIEARMFIARGDFGGEANWRNRRL